jgi:hypothetical protein
MGKERGLGFFLEFGDRRRGLAVAHNINHPGFIIFLFTAALDVRWDAWTEMAQSWNSFLIAMSCCKIATMRRKRLAFRERYDICFSGIEA